MEIDLLFINVNCLRFTSHWVFRSSRREASCMQVTRCTILHFGNLAGAVLQHVSHRVSRYLHYAVLSDVCYEVRRRWVDFLVSIRRKFLKLLFYNVLEAGINKTIHCECSIVTITKIPRFSKYSTFWYESKMFIKLLWGDVNRQRQVGSTSRKFF